MENLPKIQKNKEVVHASRQHSNLLTRLIQESTSDTLELNLVKAQAKMTIEVAVSQPDQISKLRSMDEAVLEKVMMVLVNSLAESFNVKNNFSPAQMYECATLIIERFWYMRPEEIMYAFRQAKIGRYGTSYNRIDTQVVLEWIDKYDKEDRQAAFDIKNSKERQVEPEINTLALLNEQIDIQAKGNIPWAVQESKMRKDRKQAQARKDAEFQNFQAEYYKNRQNNDQQIQKQNSDHRRDPV